MPKFNVSYCVHIEVSSRRL